MEGNIMQNFVSSGLRKVVARVLSNRVRAAVLLVAAGSQAIACGSAVDAESGEADVASTSEALVGIYPDSTLFGCASNKIRLESYYGYGCSWYSNAEMWCANINHIGQTNFGVERWTDVNGVWTDKIALTNGIDNDKRYASAVNGGGGGIYMNRSAPGAWETFQVIQLSGYRRYAFKTSNGSYLTAEQGGGSVMNANRPGPGAWETFFVGCAP